MATQQHGTIDALNSLIKVCEDSTRMFETAAETISNELLTTLFSNYAQQRSQFAIALKAEVRREGGEPEQQGTLSGSMHRSWTNIKTALSSQDGQTAIKECARSEEMVMQTYEDVLQQHLPADVINLIKRQHEEITLIHRNIQRIEQRLDALS
jgi:uncharacterized protein (TIGR02284 family)